MVNDKGRERRRGAEGVPVAEKQILIKINDFFVKKPFI